jgi:hypothetical protein
VSVDGKADEVYVRAAVDIVLKACLSPEDWDAEAERYIIREIIVKTVCIDLVPRITQPWFLHSTLLDLLGPPDEPLKVSTLHLLTFELTAIQVPRALISLSSEYVPCTFIAQYDRFFSLYRPGYFKCRPFYNSNIQACRSYHQDGTQLANTCPTTIAYLYSDLAPYARGHTSAIAIDPRNTIRAA